MQRRTISAIIVVASSLHIGSAYAQYTRYCPDLGASGPEICITIHTDATSAFPFVLSGPSPLVIPPGTVIGGYEVGGLTFELFGAGGASAAAPGIAISATGLITQTGTDFQTLVINAQGGLTAAPIPSGYTELALSGVASGNTVIQIGGGSGFRLGDLLGTGTPEIWPVTGATGTALQYGGVFGEFMEGAYFGPAYPGQPWESRTGSISVGLVLTVKSAEGVTVAIPAVAGVGPNGLASLGPLGREDGYLLLPVPSPDGSLEYFSLDQFFLGCPSCSGQHYHSAGAFVESIRGSQLTDPAPVNCGFGLVSELTVKDVDLIAEDTTLEDDRHVPDGYDLVIGPLATLTIPEGRAVFVSGEVVVLGRLVVEGELLNADGGTLTNSGKLDVDGMILNKPGAVISNDPGATITNTSNTIYNFGTIDNRGTIDNTGRIINEPGGTVTGNGAVTGNAIEEIEDSDADGVPDSNDNCPNTPNADQADADADGTGDACEEDRDGDGVADAVDNCPDVANTDQADADGDGEGDVCDPCPGAAVLLLTLTVVGLVRSRKR